MDVCSGNGVLKESRDNRSQKAGHVGMPTFVGGENSCGCVRGEGASTTGLRPGLGVSSGDRAKHPTIRRETNGDGAISRRLGTRLALGGDQAAMRGARCLEVHNDDEAAVGRSHAPVLR